MHRPVRRRRMSRIDQAQFRTADAQLNVIATKQHDLAGDALAIHQCPVKAFQICDRKLFALFPDLSVTARNHCGRSINHDFTFGIAAQASNFAVQFDSFDLARLSID